MIRGLPRLALKSSWAGSRSSLTRSVLISAVAVVAGLLVCGVASSVVMLDRETERATGRAFLLTESPEPAFRRHTMFDSAPNGDQIYIYWWEILRPNARVPGTPRAPRADSWFVSPALMQRMSSSIELQTRFPNAEVIATDGVASADELVAYRFVEPGVGLPDSLSTQTDTASYLADPTDLESTSVIRLALLLLAIPVVALLVAALGPSSPDLDRRLGLLRALGAPATSRLSLIGMHAILTTLPGALLAGLGWWLVSPRLTAVPIIGRPVFAGDLGLGMLQVVGCVASVPAVAAVCAAVRPSRTSQGRPTVSQAPESRTVRLLPLVAGGAIMALGSGMLGPESGRVFITGLMTFSIGGVLAMPIMFARVGDAIANGPGLMPLLVGRHLKWNARSAARGLIVVAALASLSPVAAGWIDLNRLRVNDNINAAEVKPVVFQGELPAAELADLAERTDTVAAYVISDPAIEPTRTSDPPRFLVADCRQLGRVVNLSTCTSESFTIGPNDETGFAGFRTYEGTEATAIRGLSDIPPNHEVGASLLIGPDWRRTEAVARAHMANRSEPGVPMGYVDNPPHEAPVVAWILGVVGLAVATGGIAVGLHLVTQSTLLAGSRTRLSALGSDIKAIRRLAGIESTLTILLAGGLSVALGWVSSWIFIQMNPEGSIQYGVLGIVIGGIITAAMIAGASSYAAVASRPRMD